MLYSLARHLSLIVPLSTQGYKWVLANGTLVDKKDTCKLWPVEPLGLYMYADFFLLVVQNNNYIICTRWD